MGRLGRPISGLRIVVVHKTNASDAAVLSGYTWIPRVVRFGVWLAIALISLWIGGRVLLGRT